MEVLGPIFLESSRRSRSQSFSTESTGKESHETISTQPSTGTGPTDETTSVGTSSVECLLAKASATRDTTESLATLGPDLDYDECEPQNGATGSPFQCWTETTCPSTIVPSAVTLERAKPFQGWIKSLQRRATRRRTGVEGHAKLQRQFASQNDVISTIARPISQCQSSLGSYAFVAVAKTASISLAGKSDEWHQRRLGTSRHSSAAPSVRSGRSKSEDSFPPERPLSVFIDQAAASRSDQRRRILEELITTEDNYIGDIRFLFNAYKTILSSLPNTSPTLRTSIARNLSEIIELHEEILAELRQTIPCDLFPHLQAQAGTGCHITRGLGIGSEVVEDSWRNCVTGMISDAQMAADVAKVFGTKMHRLFIYQEYGAKYELMAQGATMSYGRTGQRGFETLASSAGSLNSRGGHLNRKSLTVHDLLAKPIQRICRYPLLFCELLKFTPVVDCPNSHVEVEIVLARLQEATADIDRAAKGGQMKGERDKTWILQDRLVFPSNVSKSTAQNRIRTFGHVQLCGTLHVCWQASDQVEGRYMIVILYRNVLCLASPRRYDRKYMIQACISLADTSIVNADNGQGLQCKTAPYSWKLVFGRSRQVYEMVMAACSSTEEHEWRSGISRSSETTLNRDDSGVHDFLALDMKSVGPTFGKPGTMARTLSVYRAATIGPQHLCQVDLRNTWDSKSPPTTRPNSPIGRSRSLLSPTSRGAILAPSRSERARLEALLSDVWTRDVLPFPGMTPRSRPSASVVMRKLSVASITGSFSRRSSTSSTFKTVDESDGPPTPTTTDQDSVGACNKLKLTRSWSCREGSLRGTDLHAPKESMEPAFLSEGEIQPPVQTPVTVSHKTQPTTRREPAGPASRAPRKPQKINRHASSASALEPRSRPMLRWSRKYSGGSDVASALAAEREQFSVRHTTPQATARKHVRAWDRVTAVREIFGL